VVRVNFTNIEFEMKDIGVVDMVLGMEIKRDIAQKKFFCVKGSTSKMCSDVLGWNVLKS